MIDPLIDDEELRKALLQQRQQLEAQAAPAPAADIPMVQAPAPAPAPAAVGPTPVAPLIPSAQATKDDPDQVLPTGKAERVSQALYSAFSGQPLTDAFFARPSQLAQKDQALENMKAALVAKYDKENMKSQAAATAADANSPASINLRKSIRGFKAGQDFINNVGGEEVFNTLPASALSMKLDQFIKADMGKEKNATTLTKDTADNTVKKELVPLKGDEARKLEDTKQTGRVALTSQKAEDTSKLQDKKDEAAMARALVMAKAADNRFNARLSLSKDNQLLQAAAKIPKDANSVTQTGYEMDNLVKDMGGIDKVGGVGFVEGGFPNAVVKDKALKFRQLAQGLINAYQHEIAGTAVTPMEKANIDKAIGAIKLGHTIAEVKNGMDIIRNNYKRITAQALAGLNPEQVATYYGRMANPTLETTPFAPEQQAPIKTGQDNTPAAGPAPEAPAPATPAPAAKLPAMVIDKAGVIHRLQPNGKYLP